MDVTTIKKALEPDQTVFDFTKEASEDLQLWVRTNGTIEIKQSGTQLIEEGIVSNDVVILMKGTVAVNTTDHNGDSQRLAILSQGTIVGEMSWLERRPAVAEIVTETESKVLFLSIEQLDKMRSDEPKLAAEWQQLIARKLASQIINQNAWIHRYEGSGAEIEPLRKVLVMFAELNDIDLDQIATMGSLRRVPAGGILLKQEEEVASIFLILAGEAEILINVDGSTKKVGTSRRGELLGELTLLTSEAQGASATVKSTNGMELLELDKVKLKEALSDKPEFADRFFRSLNCMLSQRSRDQLLARQLAARSRTAEAEDDEDALDLTQLGNINRAGQRFHALCQKFQNGGVARL
ncbi:bacteriocin-type transport-associated family protein [Synechococcus sp. A18-25c]|uniref:cyclic nucleotide-binding domain-containing protein n=1 Tax=Synechococcus sp. A18-25c TaxID=1866938 RepID=UPI001644DA80|nr:cyclic nucleotide-binding domain-containing protein [Synechococcus sp. A18-25c]QNJ21129.1 bacteriocin-type transport-associated family protein [Synechococcus sp. A18-25c]